MNSDKYSLLKYYYIKYYFSYCSLICMFCNGKGMKKVSKMQELYLRLMTNSYKLSNE